LTLDSAECVISTIEMKNEREILCTDLLYKISWVEVTRDRSLREWVFNEIAENT